MEPNVGSNGDGGSRTEGPGRLDSRGGPGGDRPGGGGLEGDRPSVDRRGAGGLGGRAVGQMAPMLKPRLGDMYQEESEEDGEYIMYQLVHVHCIDGTSQGKLLSSI